MTSTLTSASTTRADVMAAIGRARLAPSVHNTQPWLFHLTPSGVDLVGDLGRKLEVLDPAGREFTLSCGAALLHLRLALMATGYSPQVAVFPEAGRPELVARVVLGRKGQPDESARRLDACADTRQTNRRGYAGDVDDVSLAVLQASAESEGAGLQLVADDDDETNVKVWQQAANTTQVASPAYRRELRSWVSPERHDDGIPLASTVEPSGHSHDLAARDFAFDQIGGIPEGPADTGSRLLVLFTEEETPGSWVAAGQALARLWLEATRIGLVLQPLSQSVEDPATRMLLKQGLRLMSCWPQLVLRVGHAPAQPRTHRRPVSELVVGPAASGLAPERGV